MLALAAAVFLVAGPAGGANQAADLDQCANGSTAPGTSCPPGWQNGDLNANNSHYRELDSVPFRLVLTNLAAGSHTVVIQYDTLQGGKHAYDYLTSYDRTVSGVDPCSGVSGCPAAGNTFTIPVDPLVGGAGWGGSYLPDSARKLSIWGGTITNVQIGNTTPGAPADAAGQQSVTITFTATGTAVLAWGGHVGSQINWGAGNAAGSIPGSPYHMRLISLDGAGGNQDRSMKASSIAPVPPTFETDAASGQITLGQSITDTATLAGVEANGPVTGTVTFFVCYSLTGNPTCSTSGGSLGTQVGDPVTVVNGVAPSPAYTPDAPGFYCFRALYSPDAYALYSPAEHSNTTTQSNGNHGECFGVVQPTGTLVVIKHVVNDNGGSATSSQWSMHVSAGGADVTGSPFAGAESPGTSTVLATGTYAVSETGGPVGYAATFSGDCDANGNVTVAANATKTCVVTNDDVAPKLHLRKTVVNDDGGSAAATAWTLTATGPSTLTGTTPVDSGASFKAGTYTLSESGGPSGYTAGAWSCDGGTLAGDKLTLGLGADVTCTIVNDDDGPQLTLVKTVSNTHGGTAIASDWTLAATGSSKSFSGAGPSTGAHGVSAGVQYTLSESGGPSGYAAGAWSCSGGTFVAPDKVTLALGADVTCTLVNSDVAPKLTLVKVVDNTGGGTATPSQWTLSATGSSGSFSGAGPSTGAHAVVAGVEYALAESGGPAGYTPSAWSCDGGTLAGDKLTLPLGADVTCTIVNSLVAPKLTLVKTVSNTHGGTADAGAWTLSATGSSGSFSGAGPSTGAHAVTPGVQYTLAEAGGPSGYAAGAWSCSGGTVVAPDKVTLAAGADVTCTLVNSDVAPKLTLVKVVSNANGGTATPGQFTLAATGAEGSFSGTGPSTGAHAVVAGVEYTLAESGGPAGYTPSAWSCDGGTLAGDTLTLALGANVTCTITNTDVAPTLTLVKTVVNDDGGTATPAAFTLSATGSSGSFSGAGPSTGPHAVRAGVQYTLGESGPSGYAAGAWSCDGGTLTGGKLTLPPAASVTCSIVNDDVAAPQPPPPAAPTPPPAPRIDLAVTKTDTPDPVNLAGNLTYTITVTNNGPDTATGVQAADALPAGTSFVGVTTAKGTCTGGAVVSCSLGTMATGESAAITLVVQPTATGTVTNTVTVVGKEAETNTANNTASATTLVIAPFTPPVVKPKPAPKPACVAVAVSPKSLTVGRSSALHVLVTQARRPVAGARVHVRGAGIDRTSSRTNRHGKASVALRPKQPGILRIAPAAGKGCSTPRVGIIGVFTPPVTG